jgi:hypothetical protein
LETGREFMSILPETLYRYDIGPLEPILQFEGSEKGLRVLKGQPSDHSQRRTGFQG